MGIITLGLVVRNKKTQVIGTVIAVLYELNKPIQVTIKEGREEEWVDGKKRKPIYLFANESSEWEFFDMPYNKKKKRIK